MSGNPKDQPAKEQPVFIVGVPRSGTTLLAAMLSAHSKFGCGPETHIFRRLTDDIEKAQSPFIRRLSKLPGGFFRDVRTQRMRAVEENLCDPQHWPERAVDYLFAIVHGGAPVPISYNASREDLTAWLRAAPKTIHSIASVLPALFARKLGKERWIEKTPDHLICVKKIREHFPDAPIIRIIRDPRDVALSLEKVPWGPATFTEALIVWRRFHSLSDDFFTTDKRSASVHYEDLVAAPEEELQRLCRFLDITFEPGMLDTSQTGAQVNKTNEPWKKKVADKVDKARANAWKEVLTPDQKREANAIIGQYTPQRQELKGLQYWKIQGLYGLRESADLELLRQFIRSSDVRFWGDAGEHPAGVLFVGHPQSSQWLGERPALIRFLKSLAIALQIASCRLRGQRVVWQWHQEPGRKSAGCCSQLLAILAGKRQPS